MQKNIILSILLFFLAFTLQAQRFSVTSFKQDAADPSANMYAVMHFNGEYCALIKVLTNASNLSFETTPDLEKFEEKKDGEFWVYVPPGIKRIVIRKKGFIPKEYVFPANIKIKTKLTYVMELEASVQNTEEEEAQPEFVVINSTPEGASVYFKNPVNDEFEYKGKTPYQAPMFEGVYEYKIEKELYLTHTASIEVKAGNTINENIILKSNYGVITINSQPSGGQILLNGKNINATTPYTIEQMPVGKNIITVEKEMYEPSKQNIDIVAGDKKELNFTLNPIFGTVNIKTTPEADIFIDNKKEARGTYTGKLVNGIHVIEARKDKYHPQKQTLTVEKGKDYPINIELKPITGIISIMTTPVGANIYLDNEKKGQSPKFLRNIQIGEYTLKLEKQGYGTITKTITVEKGKTTEINETLPQGEKITINTTPTGANIYIDGNDAGITRYTGTLSYGQHKIKLINGKKTVEETISISQNGKTNWTFDVNEFGNFTETKSNLNLEMIAVQGGTYRMGCTSEQTDCGSDEKPAHNVTLNDFYIGKYEVTQKQWYAIMGTRPSHFSGCDNCPVERVSWDDIQEFLQKLNAKTGKKYRLPTEAEWEYAARGGVDSHGRAYKYSGSNNIDDVAWYGYEKSGKKTHNVGTKQANELGIYDMTGNVYEWCSDWYDKNYYSNSPQNNPQGASSGSYRVLRGGSWGGNSQNCRVAFRYDDFPDSRNYNRGFRVAF